MKRAILLLLFVLASGASAQPNPPADIEKIIVSAPKYNFAVTPNAISHVFIGSFAMPSLLLGTIPRWQTGICPEIRGLRPDLADFISRRLLEIAAQAGAPVKEKSCAPNLSVTFTPEPQKLLDNIRAKDAEALGYHGAVIISHPIQAWYSTGTVDIDGHVFKDVETIYHDDTINPFMVPPKFIVTSSTPMPKVEGMPGRTGLKSRFLGVFIIVDSHQTANLQVNAVADYLAMLALSQTKAYDSCQMVPSIANLIAPDCDDKLKPDSATASDMAYLKGLYAKDAGASLIVQQDQIAGEMATALGGQ